MTTLQQIKAWWSGSRVPTVIQRQETFDSFRHKDDKVAIGDVTDLSSAMNAKADLGEDGKVLPEQMNLGGWDVDGNVLQAGAFGYDEFEDLSFLLADASIFTNKWQLNSNGSLKLTPMGVNDLTGFYYTELAAASLYMSGVGDEYWASLTAGSNGLVLAEGSGDYRQVQIKPDGSITTPSWNINADGSGSLGAGTIGFGSEGQLGGNSWSFSANGDLDGGGNVWSIRTNQATNNGWLNGGSRFLVNEYGQITWQDDGYNLTYDEARGISTAYWELDAIGTLRSKVNDFKVDLDSGEIKSSSLEAKNLMLLDEAYSYNSYGSIVHYDGEFMFYKSSNGERAFSFSESGMTIGTAYESGTYQLNKPTISPSDSFSCTLPIGNANTLALSVGDNFADAYGNIKKVLKSLTTTQTNALSGDDAATGVMYYNTTLDCPVYKSAAGWRKFSHTAM